MAYNDSIQINYITTMHLVCNYIIIHYSDISGGGTILLVDKYLKFLLPEWVSQDPIESYYKDHRSMGRQNMNANVQQFCETADILCVSRGLSKKRGNVRGKEKDTLTTSTITLRKRKQKHKANN